jgi:CRISPR-associated protein Cas1
MHSADLGAIAEQTNLGSGELVHAARAVVAGEYVPSTPYTVEIVTSHGKHRRLSIPSRLDRALQRAVSSTIYPAIDTLLEDSALAYRRGLGRYKAAQRIARLYQAGYRTALKSDFCDFFPSVDRRLLRERLDAYLNDESLSNMVMAWVCAGDPESPTGLPLGAPLSPLLSNLLLDNFDEAVSKLGGKLVRYADDFMMLFRERSRADQIAAGLASSAAALRLSLNGQKTALLDLDEPFEFLGLRFERDDEWRTSGEISPVPVDDLGWHEAGRKRTLGTTRLPGENSAVESTNEATLIVGPNLEQIRLEGNDVVCRHGRGEHDTVVPLAQIREIVALGCPTLTSAFLQAALERSIVVHLSDFSGNPLGTVSRAPGSQDAETVAAQLACAADASRKAVFATRLIRAKILNYATLARTLGDSGITVAASLVELVSEPTTSDPGRILGVEGAAARAWYGWWGLRLPAWAGWRKRVAPSAADPANSLLNLGYSALHRLATQCALAAGLEPMVGLMHRPRAGHAALASDLVEPFRHLIDLEVLEALLSARASDFERVEDEKYSLRIKPALLRRFMGSVHSRLATSVAGMDGLEPCSYRHHILREARSLRRWLFDTSEPQSVFEHPT